MQSTGLISRVGADGRPPLNARWSRTTGLQLPVDFRISDEQRAFVDTVRRICQKDFKSRAIRDLDGTWPAENMKRLAEIGVLGIGTF